MSEVRACHTCRWWDNDGSSSDRGACRFNPPSVFWIDDDGKFETRFPVTFDSEWCRKHEFSTEKREISRE
jgi:hypothetical protein